MKTEVTFLLVNAKERIPERDGNYITLYKPEGLNYACTLKNSNRKEIWFLAKEQNMFDVYWLEQRVVDVEENINLTIDDKTKLTFDKNTHELIKL